MDSVSYNFKATEPLLKVVPNIDAREGNDSSTKLPKTKKASFRKKDALGWDTRIRTRNDRTRICSVTITPYPNVFLLLQCYFLIASAKVILFSEPTKFFSTFLSKNVIFFHFYAFSIPKYVVLRHTNLKKTEKLEESNAYSFFCTIFVVE